MRRLIAVSAMLCLSVLIVVTLSSIGRVVAQTDPTETRTPTDTATPSDTPTASNTPTPGNTKTATAQARNWNATGTAIQLGITKTQQADNRTATAVQLGLTRTQQMANVAATAVGVNATRTTVAIVSKDMSQYKPIAHGELVSYADKHGGEMVKVSGQVFNIVGDSTFQMYLDGSFDGVIVKTPFSLHDIYKDSYVTVYAFVKGTEVYTNGYGNQVSEPSLQAIIVTVGNLTLINADDFAPTNTDEPPGFADTAISQQFNDNQTLIAKTPAQ